MRLLILVAMLATVMVARAAQAQNSPDAGVPERSASTGLPPPPRRPDASVVVPASPDPPPPPTIGQALVCSGLTNDRICELLHEVDAAQREHRAPFVGPPAVAPVVPAAPAVRRPPVRPSSGACRNGPTSQGCCQPGQLFVAPTDGSNVGVCRSVVTAVRDSLTASRRALAELSALRATLPAAVLDAIDCVERANGNPAARQACVTTLAGALAAPASTL